LLNFFDADDVISISIHDRVKIIIGHELNANKALSLFVCE
jgi:hypothetical protein